MQTGANPTVMDLFSGQTDAMMQKLSEMDSGKNIAALKQAFAEKARGVLRWQDAFAEAGQKVGALLDIKITDILVRAWQKHAELQQYADRDKHPPEESILVPLSTHEVRSEHHPCLEIFIGDHLLGRMVFDLILTLEVKGLILKIQDARIREIRTGECRGAGVFEFEKVVLLEKESQDIPLPGRISLGDGIALG